MRIGIDAHIILPKHKRYDPKIARYTEKLITQLIESDKKQEHTWVLFFDKRMEGSKKVKKFQKENVEIKHFPFIQYRKYLPVVYSHMLVSSFLRAAKLDVFHSPEGLIPFIYPGKIVTTFHYVPSGETESNMFVRTFMLGAKSAFHQLCQRAKRIIVNTPEDKNLLTEKHGVDEGKVVVMKTDNISKVNWSKRTKELIDLYRKVSSDKSRKTKKKTTKKAKGSKKKKKTSKKAERKKAKQDKKTGTKKKK